MSDPVFEAAVATVLSHEGGYVDDPRDPGRATKYGISAAQYPGLDIGSLTRDEAKAIYLRDWWLKYRFGRIQPPTVAVKVFDAAVTMGPDDAFRCLQRAIRAATRQPLADDGEIGPVTLAALAQADGAALLAALRSEIACHYRLVAQDRPGEAGFLVGWLNRSYA